MRNKQSHLVENTNNPLFDTNNVFAGNYSLIKNNSENDDWVTTYMDLITLLLTLFIVLLAYSSQSDEAAFSETTQKISKTVQGNTQKDSADEIHMHEIFGDALMKNLSSAQFAGEVFSFQRSGDDVEIQLDSEIIFGSGNAELTENALRQLKSLSIVLAEPDYFISIEGHTDNLPINTPRYPSNWELSSARASSVARFLINQGIDDSHIRVIGYADSRPVASNLIESGRKQNRRVTLVVSQQPE